MENKVICKGCGNEIWVEYAIRDADGNYFCNRCVVSQDDSETNVRKEGLKKV